MYSFVLYRISFVVFFSNAVHCWCSAPLFFSPTDEYDGQPREALSSIMPIILGGKSVVAESIIDIFCPCAIMSAVSGYWHISLIAMGGIA